MFSRIFAEFRPDENSALATLALLDLLHVPANEDTVRESLTMHPAFPSLLSISEALKGWGVDNVSLQVESERLDEIPIPFLAHMKFSGGRFVAVSSVSPDQVVYSDYDKYGKKIVRKRSEFLEEWSGYTLVAEPNERSGEPRYAQTRRKMRLRKSRIPFIFGSFLILLAAYMIAVSWVAGLPALALSLLCMVKLAGSVVSALLLWYELDQSNRALQQFCSHSKHTSCAAVLASKNARIFGWISWSEIGFFYFTGGLLLSLFSSGQSYALFFSAWLNLFALPYTVFSVIYQWRVVKQWCPLCLLVQALLAAEFLVCLFGFWLQPGPHAGISASSLLTLVNSFAIPIFFWVFAKSFLLETVRSHKNKAELGRLKHDPEIFEALLPRQKKVDHEPAGLGITLGNPSASTTIIKVCNPYCNPCSKAHPEIERLLHEREDLKVQIIFTATIDESDKRSRPVKHLMALNDKDDPALMTKALDDWYLAEKKDYEAFAAKYPLNGELKVQDEKLMAMEDWCKNNDISATPTFFINGYKLPEIYSFMDLKYFLSS